MNMLRKRRWLLVALVLVILASTAFVAPARAQQKFVYWGGLIFSDDANNLFVKRVQEWGKAKNIAVEVVMINQNDTVQKVSAAIESNTMPDALDLGYGFMLLLSKQNKLEPVDKIYEDLGKAQGGWYEFADKLSKIKDFNGKIYGIPYGASGNILFRRADALTAAGIKDEPKTWEDVSKMAAAAQKPPKLAGMGFALSNVGDGNITTTWLQAWGGRIADNDGKKCTIDSPETRKFLTWVSKAFADGLFPAGVTTWDGAGDNNAYQAGNVIFIANTGSVYVNIVKNDPDLAKNTLYSALPAGPAMRLSPANIVVRSIPTSSKNKEAAIDLLNYLADPKFNSDYFANAIYGPVLKNQADSPIFKQSPAHAGLLDLAKNGTPGAFPDTENAAFSEYQTNFLTPKMVQRIVVDKISIDQAITETQTACQKIYDKYK